MMSCPNCIEGAILSGEPQGSTSAEFQAAYYAPGPGPEPSKRAVILLTDVFGLSLPNPKLMADQYAKRLECDVWVPDWFNGWPIIPADKLTLPDRAGLKTPRWQWLTLILTLIPRIPALISNRSSVVDARVKSFITLIKEKKKYEKVGAVGYCYGGSGCIRLGGTGLVDSVVIAHPGPLTMDQINAIKVPASWICAEEDAHFADPVRLKCEASFAARKDKPNFVEYEFRQYKDTCHGFATRPNLALPEIKEAFESAFDQTVNWFKKTLVV